MAYAGPELLTGDHLLERFDCGKPALNEWVVRRALNNQANGTSRTWVVVESDSHNVVAFYASATASVLRSSTPKRMRRNQPEEMPAILLARMAVDSRHKGQGLGAALLKHFMLKALEVAESVGVRVPLIHAKDDEAKSFYSHYGFVESPIDPLVSMVLPGELYPTGGSSRWSANGSKRMTNSPRNLVTPGRRSPRLSVRALTLVVPL